MLWMRAGAFCIVLSCFSRRFLVSCGLHRAQRVPTGWRWCGFSEKSTACDVRARSDRQHRVLRHNGRLMLSFRALGGATLESSVGRHRGEVRELEDQCPVTGQRYTSPGTGL